MLVPGRFCLFRLLPGVRCLLKCNGRANLRECPQAWGLLERFEANLAVTDSMPEGDVFALSELEFKRARLLRVSTVSCFVPRLVFVRVYLVGLPLSCQESWCFVACLLCLLLFLSIDRKGRCVCFFLWDLHAPQTKLQGLQGLRVSRQKYGD